MLETALKKLTEQLERVATALEAVNSGATLPSPPVGENPEEVKEPEAEPEEEEEPEAEPPKKRTRKLAKKTSKKEKKQPEPEEDEPEEFEDNSKEASEVTYKDVADHIRKTRESLLKANGTRGPIPHKKLTKNLLEEWGVSKVSEIEADQMGVFFEELKGAEEEADL